MKTLELPPISATEGTVTLTLRQVTLIARDGTTFRHPQDNPGQFWYQALFDSPGVFARQRRLFFAHQLLCRRCGQGLAVANPEAVVASVDLPVSGCPANRLEVTGPGVHCLYCRTPNLLESPEVQADIGGALSLLLHTHNLAADA